MRCSTILDAAVEAVGAVDSNIPDPVRRYRVLERLETAQRRLIAVSHDHIARLGHVEGCPPVPVALADVLRIPVAPKPVAASATPSN